MKSPIKAPSKMCFRTDYIRRTWVGLNVVIHVSLRSDTFCLTGSITVMIYEAEEPNMTVMSYTAHAGEDAEIICPHLNYFKRSQNPKWHKVGHCTLWKT